MTETSNSPFWQLHQVVSDLRQLLKQAEFERDAVARSVRQADRISISSRHGYDDGETSAMHAMAVELKDRFIEDIRRKAEAEREETMAKLAARVEQLRVVLPGMAAAACIDLGVIARGGYEPGGTS